jgi:creatinine amidohydrolase
VLFPYWTQVGDLLSEQERVEHACEVETSLALHLFPELVRVDRIEDGPAEGSESRYRAFPEGIATGPPEEGWSGAEGFPSAASAETGRAIFERCLGPMLRAVREHAGGRV